MSKMGGVKGCRGLLLLDEDFLQIWCSLPNVWWFYCFKYLLCGKKKITFFSIFNSAPSYWKFFLRQIKTSVYSACVSPGSEWDTLKIGVFGQFVLPRLKSQQQTDIARLETGVVSRFQSSIYCIHIPNSLMYEKTNECLRDTFLNKHIKACCRQLIYHLNQCDMLLITHNFQN